MNNTATDMATDPSGKARTVMFKNKGKDADVSNRF